MDDGETFRCVERFGTEPEHGAGDARVLEVTQFEDVVGFGTLSFAIKLPEETGL